MQRGKAMRHFERFRQRRQPADGAYVDVGSLRRRQCLYIRLRVLSQGAAELQTPTVGINQQFTAEPRFQCFQAAIETAVVAIARQHHDRIGRHRTINHQEAARVGKRQHYGKYKNYKDSCHISPSDFKITTNLNRPPKKPAHQHYSTGSKVTYLGTAEARKSTVFGENIGTLIAAMQQPSTKAGRREPRFPLQMPILVFGYDRLGRAFMEQAQTLDISLAGARLTGLSSEVTPGFILAVQQGDRRARFQVLWVGQAHSELEGHIGLRCVEVGGHTRKRILCIEANPLEEALQRSYLETAGYDFVCCAEWRQGLAVFQESAFDLLMVDVQPGCEEPGDFISFVRQNSPRTRIMLLSNSPGRIPEVLLNQANSFIDKANSRHELLTVVEEMIGAGNQMRWPLARLAARYLLETPVLISSRRSSVLSIEGRSKDISELGLGVEAEGELAPGELVRLDFRLPGDDVDLTPEATVRRRVGSHYGFEFVSIAHDRLEELRLICQKLPRISLPQPV